MRDREVMAVARRGDPATRIAWIAICAGMSACGRVPLDAPVILSNGGADAHVTIEGGADTRTAGDARVDAQLADDRPADAHSAIDSRSDAHPATDGRSDATAACSTDGGLQPNQSVVGGEVDGPEVDGVVCAGGAFAYLERTVYGKFLMLIENSTMGDPSRRFQFQKPANVTLGELVLLTEIGAPTPGTYTSGQTCGSIALCGYLPTPPVDCGDGGVSASCPPGCELEGPVLGPICTAITPYFCYDAYAPSNCLGYPQTVQGSWTLTLTSVDAYDDSSQPAIPSYVVHGALNATLIGGGMNGGNEPATLALTF